MNPKNDGEALTLGTATKSTLGSPLTSAESCSGFEWKLAKSE